MKTTLLSVTFLLVALLSQAQIRFSSLTVAEGRISARTSLWVYDDAVNCSVIFTFNKRVITADDKAGSVYYITKTAYEEDKNEFKQTGWTCLDEKGRVCRTKLMLYKDGRRPQFYVFYDDISFCYTLSKTPVE